MHLSEKFVAACEKLSYWTRSFPGLFWGEQPPFASFRAWRAVLFYNDGDDGAAIFSATLQLDAGSNDHRAGCDRRGSFRF